jgi:putative tryptophan/tyrosine transport system substrate-binding protein
MRVGVVLLILTILAAPLAVEAQQAGKVPRVGFLGGVPRSDPGFRAFEARLRKLGYVDGRSIAIEFRTSAANLDLLSGLAAKPVRRNVDQRASPRRTGSIARSSISTHASTISPSCPA